MGGPAHPGDAGGSSRTPGGPVGMSGGQEGLSRTSEGRTGVLEGIMNGGAVTAFLPNFVGFPSLRGLHCSTVQPRRTPRRPWRTPEHTSTHRGVGSGGCSTGVTGGYAVPLDELSCPVSAASSTASTTATTGRPAPAGRPAARGVTATAGVVPPGVMTSGVVPARRPAVSPAGPPAAAVAAVRAAPAPPAERLRPALARCLRDDRHERDHDRHHDDAGNHDATVLSFPPKQPPVGASLLA